MEKKITIGVLLLVVLIIINAVIGACILLFVIRMVKR